MWLRFIRLLRDLEPNRHFGKLWLSQALSLTAFNMINFTLLIRVFDLTHSSILVSLFVLSFGIPSLLFGAIAGVFADRWNRRSVLIVTNLIRAIVVIAFIPALHSLPLIYLVTFVIATVTQFFTPAEAALIPELVEKRRLVGANAVFMMTMFVSFIIGYGLAGPLAAIGGDALPIILAAVMFALATVAGYALPPSHHRPAAPVPLRSAYGTVLASLREGVQAVREHGSIRFGIAQLTFIWATIGVVMVVLPAFTSQVLGLNLREVSRAIIIPIGAGMLGGGFWLHRLRRSLSLRMVITVHLLVAGLAVLVLGLVQTIAPWLIDHHLSLAQDPFNARQGLTAVAAAVLGLAIAVVMIASQTLLHERTDASLRGRIFGVLGMSINVANTVPVLLTGLLTDLLSAATTVTAVGVLLLVWGVVSYIVGRDQVLTASPASG